MRANEVMGIIFPNIHDNMMMELTEKRSMGSVPFGGRYRNIDFALSNLVNAGIRRVAIITKANYHSLMDHLGAGKAWDLDRKNGGLFIIPPYSIGNGVYAGKVDALLGIMTFLKDCTEKYVVLYDSDVICNIDIETIVDAHLKNNADVTIAYKQGKLPNNNRDLMFFELNKRHKITDICFSDETGKACNFSLDIMVLEREKLIELIEFASIHNYTDLSVDVFQHHLSDLTMYGYKVNDYVIVMDGINSYFESNMALLSKDVRAQLFARERPVYTKTRDDMPAKYGLGATATNSIIADGSVIEGTVENCIIFRGVKIGKNAVVKNCIIMQDTVINEGAVLNYIITDKDVIISKGRCLTGSENYPMVIRKGTTV